MSEPALHSVTLRQTGLPHLRVLLDRLSPGSDPYVIRMWSEALSEAEGRARGPQSDPLAFPYVPFVPEQFGLALSAGSHVLDLGCLGGFGLFDFAVRRLRVGRPLPHMIGVDVDRESLALGVALSRAWVPSGRLRFDAASGESLPYADAAFDLVIARSVLQYLRIQPALAELARVVRRGGLVLLQVHALGYYVRQIARHLRAPLQAAYYARALVSGLVFSGACLQPRHRWFREAAMTLGRLRTLCAAVGLEPVWSNRDPRRPLALFVRT